MGAKNKPPKRPVTLDEQELLRVHLEASRLRDELLEEARVLRRAGKIAQARKAQASAEGISRELRKVENARRNRAPVPR